MVAYLSGRRLPTSVTTSLDVLASFPGMLCLLYSIASGVKSTVLAQYILIVCRLLRHFTLTVKQHKYNDTRITKDNRTIPKRCYTLQRNDKYSEKNSHVHSTLFIQRASQI